MESSESDSEGAEGESPSSWQGMDDEDYHEKKDLKKNVTAAKMRTVKAEVSTLEESSQ